MLLLAAAWLLLQGRGVLAAGPPVVPRFHRYVMTALDETTVLDPVKDAAHNTCWLVYRVRPVESSSIAAAVTTLGVVPCEPIPVPGGSR